MLAHPGPFHLTTFAPDHRSPMKLIASALAFCTLFSATAITPTDPPPGGDPKVGINIGDKAPELAFQMRTAKH